MAQQTLALPPDLQNGPKYLNDHDARVFWRKRQHQSQDRRQLTHTTTELIPGVFGATIGFMPRYEPEMEGRTPDWLFLDLKGKPRFFADVLSFHINESIE
jgi:hypothetical protein